MVVSETAAQFHLLHLARRAIGQRLDEDDIVRNPPFGDLALEKGDDRFCRCRIGRPGTITSSGRSSHCGCGTPITAASATAGQPTAKFSTSIELIHSPPDL